MLCSWMFLEHFEFWTLEHWDFAGYREIGWIDLGTLWMFFLFFNLGFNAGGGCILQEGFGPSVDSGSLSWPFEGSHLSRMPLYAAFG